MSEQEAVFGRKSLQRLRDRVGEVLQLTGERGGARGSGAATSRVSSGVSRWVRRW